jgi:hypothetical protein
MKIICPKCKAEIPPNDVNVAAALAYCPACAEGFPLSALVADGGPPRVEAPAAPVSTLHRDGDVLTLSLPPGGFRGPGCFFLGFSLFWNAITWTFLGIFILNAIAPGTIKVKSKGDLPGVFVFLFLTPFVLIGIGTFVAAIFNIFGRYSLVMDRVRGIYRQEVFGFKWDKKFDLSEISSVELVVAYTQNNIPVYSVGLIREGLTETGEAKPWRSRISFGSGLPESERRWLCGEINAFWREMTGKPD